MWDPQGMSVPSLTENQQKVKPNCGLRQKIKPIVQALSDRGSFQQLHQPTKCVNPNRSATANRSCAHYSRCQEGTQSPQKPSAVLYSGWRQVTACWDKGFAYFCFSREQFQCTAIAHSTERPWHSHSGTAPTGVLLPHPPVLQQGTSATWPVTGKPLFRRNSLMHRELETSIPSMRAGTEFSLEGALTFGKILENHNFFHYITGRREEQPWNQAGRAQECSEPSLKAGTFGIPSESPRGMAVFEAQTHFQCSN
ncbi:uncharacterized protein LOC131080855 [Melospiza georgiana]|uniref:uncharacterized protein LOC131080855 n=1 Tax=Melospiza georgiana TaxID=44398 RepID=UPI0025AD7A4D|nr:uncharacterized protein LOC131080855 [Melospiza georgiana]